MAGFECTDQLNAFGNRVDLLTTTRHLELINEDYDRLAPFAMKTVREGIRWSQVEKRPYEYDWSSVAYMMQSAKDKNIQQVWDLCHFGYPDDLTPLHPLFARRFAALCRAFVYFYRSQNTDDILIVTPINEVSFISWLGGDVRGTSPYCVGQGWEVKYALMRAYIEGIQALKEVEPGIRILTTEPLVNIVPGSNATDDQIIKAAQLHENQYQVLDMLCGRMCSELGGDPSCLDILGFNYYYNNQWVCDPHETLCWKDARLISGWKTLSQLLREVYQRYDCPIVLTETSHPKEDRSQWIQEIAQQCALAFENNIPLWGICWYPIIDRPDWDHLHIWHQAGLWDEAFEDNVSNRVLHLPLAQALLEAQVSLQKYID
jgi:beta-glucosidase/6-phospho-beta-glucosidase/beta-galactosidase